VFAGPSLPKPTSGAAMLPNPDGTSVILIGGRSANGSDIYSDLYELKCTLTTSCYWSFMEQKLIVPRYGLVAMYVPNSFADSCVEKTTTETINTWATGIHTLGESHTSEK
jgi:hypothetical protein